MEDLNPDNLAPKALLLLYIITLELFISSFFHIFKLLFPFKDDFDFHLNYLSWILQGGGWGACHGDVPAYYERLVKTIIPRILSQ